MPTNMTAVRTYGLDGNAGIEPMVATEIFAHWQTSQEEGSPQTGFGAEPPSGIWGLSPKRGLGIQTRFGAKPPTGYGAPKRDLGATM